MTCHPWTQERWIVDHVTRYDLELQLEFKIIFSRKLRQITYGQVINPEEKIDASFTLLFDFDKIL
jgi:hypothetical protein